MVGVIAGASAAALFQSLAVGTGVTVLFVSCGLTWRRDMPPVIPFCLAFQWIGAQLGVMYFLAYGQFPGGDDPGNLSGMLYATQLGFLCLVLGFRVGMRFFARGINRILATRDPAYNLKRLAGLTVALFGSSYLFDVVPSELWFGGAQIIANLLAVRFVPFFVLILAVFEQKRGYGYLALTTIVVVLPQLLTGFSNFKEVFFVIVLGLLFQWRPWMNTPTQRKRNWQVISGCVAGSVVILWLGLIWSGGVKAEWRQEIWYRDDQSIAAAAPTERMAQFFRIAGNGIENFDLDSASATLAARLSSGSFYFSRVLDRVPQIIPHQQGKLLGMAVENAVVPRFIVPEKTNLGGDSWLVRTYAGVAAAGNESGASIGLGYMPEFYIDFGFPGIAILCFAFAFLLTFSMWLFAKVSTCRSVFIALTIGLLINYFTASDASNIKLLAGVVQRTLIIAITIAVLAPPAVTWLVRSRRTQRPQFTRSVRGRP